MRVFRGCEYMYIIFSLEIWLHNNSSLLCLISVFLSHIYLNSVAFVECLLWTKFESLERSISIVCSNLGILDKKFHSFRSKRNTKFGLMGYLHVLILLTIFISSKSYNSFIFLDLFLQIRIFCSHSCLKCNIYEKNRNTRFCSCVSFAQFLILYIYIYIEFLHSFIYIYIYIYLYIFVNR